LPPIFPGRIAFASIQPFKTIWVGKNKLGKFKAQTVMLLLVGLVFAIVPFNVCPMHD